MLRIFFFTLFDWIIPLLYNAVLVSAVQQHESAISKHIYPLALEPPSYPPQSLGRHRALSWAPWAAGQPPTSCLFPRAVCACRHYVRATVSAHPTLSFPHRVRKPILHRSISVPALQRGSSEIKKRIVVVMILNSTSWGLPMGLALSAVHLLTRSLFTTTWWRNFLLSPLYRRGNQSTERIP